MVFLMLVPLKPDFELPPEYTPHSVIRNQRIADTATACLEMERAFDLVSVRLHRGLAFLLDGQTIFS